MLEDDGVYTFLILEAAPEDKGQYECVAMNQNGEARCEASFQITSTAPQAQTAKGGDMEASAPVVKHKLESMVVEEGQPAMFRCHIAGFPCKCTPPGHTSSE